MNTTLTQEPETKSKQPQRISASTTQSRPATSHKAWVAKSAKQSMVLEIVDLGPFQAEDVEIAVEHCGLCHSDLSVLNNEWGISQYPAILGHEVIGRVTTVGPNANWAWAIPLPAKLNFAEAGPLLCGGVTVFAPLAMHAKPTSRVGIIGIGGLGHMAVKFAAAYGCEVTAFTSSESKFDEARGFGANHVVSSKDSAGIKQLAGSFDLLISTVNVPLDWDAMIGTLAPNGRLHVVGAVLEPIPVAAFSLIMGQRSISGSPTGSPVVIEQMLDFASRHNIAPQTEHFPMSRINAAFAPLESGKARYRIVLDADF